MVRISAPVLHSLKPSSNSSQSWRCPGLRGREIGGHDLRAIRTMGEVEWEFSLTAPDLGMHRNAEVTVEGTKVSVSYVESINRTIAARRCTPSLISRRPGSSVRIAKQGRLPATAARWSAR
jgi:hypothetical protein